MLYRSLVFSLALPALLTTAVAQPAYKAPRTPWGVPDLQGYYLNRTTTPVERPANLGSKEFYTAEELAAMQAAAAARPAAQTEPGTSADAHYDMEQFGLDSGTSGTVKNLRTSLVVGPTGRIPPTIPEATKRINDERNAARGHEYDGAENRGMAERCIYWNFEGPPLMPGGYNSNLQIFQGPNEVLIRNEMMGGARIIYTDGRKHLDPSIRQWYGNSIGHWEGETLVAETTNFNDRPPLGRGATRNLKVNERFTRVSEDAIKYEFTVTDPSTWETSWSGEYMIQKIKGPIYEYGCQEGNYGMPNILSGARAAEQEAAKK